MRIIYSLAAILLGLSASTQAGELPACDNISLNAVESLKSYSNGSIKVFKIDNEEPAGGNIGIAIAINRGESLDKEESFCRYVPYLSDANFKKIKSSYDDAHKVLTLSIPVIESDPETGKKSNFKMILKIDKRATDEKKLVTFEIEK